jgi:hypothetical protein
MRLARSVGGRPRRRRRLLFTRLFSPVYGLFLHKKTTARDPFGSFAVVPSVVRPGAGFCLIVFCCYFFDGCGLYTNGGKKSARVVFVV